jgi:Ca2+-binding EF-hand superfamily protein
MDKLDGLHQIRKPDPNGGSGRLEDLSEALDRLGSKPVQNLPGSVTGESVVAIGINPNAPNGGVISRENQGYGVDLNDNGHYDRGQDAIIGFDSNHDGKIDQREVEHTNNILSAYGGGSADTDGDGVVSAKEKLQNASYRAQYAALDKDHDGKLSNSELKAAGAQAWVDSDKDGRIDKGETQDISKIKTNGEFFNRKESKITELDPSGKTSVRQKEQIFKSPGFPHITEHGKLGEAIKDAGKNLAEAAKQKVQPNSEPKHQQKIEHKIDPKK